MNEVELSAAKQEMVHEKYLAIRYDFLIGFEAETVAGDYEALYSGDMSWPVPSCHSVSSSYGMRIHPVDGQRKMHYGIDVPAREGTRVTAPADGKVMSYTWSDACGWIMVLDHGKNERGQRITTRYLHLSAKVAGAGQTVKAGDIIAEVGNTGYYSTGSHLHFEVYYDGVTVDPAGFFHAR